MLSSGWFLPRSYVFAFPVFPSCGGGFCPWMMELRSAERRAKPPASQGQRGELLTWRPSAGEEDEEGVCDFFCWRSSESGPEDEPGYALIDNDLLPFLCGSFPRRTWRHHPRFSSLTENRAGHREDATVKNKFFGSGEVLAFDELSQTKHGHVLEHSETDPVWLLERLLANLERDHDVPDWEEDEGDVFSPSPGGMMTWPSQQVSVSVFRAHLQPEPGHSSAAVAVGAVPCGAREPPGWS